MHVQLTNTKSGIDNNIQIWKYVNSVIATLNLEFLFKENNRKTVFVKQIYFSKKHYLLSTYAYQKPENEYLGDIFTSKLTLN